MTFRKVVLAALLMPLAAAPVSAQSWKWDWGVNAGYSFFNKLLDQDQTGITDNAPAEEVKFAQGIIYGSQLTFWPSSKLGLRLNARYGSHDVKGNDLGTFDFVEDVNLWAGTLDLMLRLKAPAEEFTKMEMLPYLAGGLGVKWHNPGFDQFTCNDPVEQKSWTCGPFTTGLGAGGTTTPVTRSFGVGELKQFMGHLGLGADWRLSRGLALRTEISDQIYRPRVNQLNEQTTQGRTTYTMTQSDNNVANLIHEIAGQIGLHFLFGVPRAAEVAVVTPPPAAPAPTPVETPPAPTPERTESLTICVVDPTAPGGIRWQTATFYPTRGDTMVSVNGQNVLLRNAVGNVMVASNADWYIRAQPLTMTVGTEKVEFVTTGSARLFDQTEAGELSFLGTINGMAVYADKDDVKDVIGELNDIRRAQNNNDLAKILGEQKDLRDELEDVKVLYVPLQPTGCVFQAVQRQEAVRKSR
jgi:hypothetical protein